jgi:hypothetical protein
MSNEYALTREQMLASAQQELAAFQDMYNRYARALSRSCTLN